MSRLHTFFSENKIPCIFVGMFFLLATSFNILVTGEQQFTYLAQSFLNGKPWFLEMPGTWDETILFHGQYYWHLSPFPAVFLMPFVLIASFFHLPFYQGYIQIILTAGVYGCAFWLARRYQYSSRDALWLAFAFCFASIYQFNAFVPWSWYFSQVLAVSMMFAALVEFHTRRRAWVIGLLCAALFMTRFPAGFASLFFLCAVTCDRTVQWREKVHFTLRVGACIALAALLLMSYNYVRFENPFDSGYTESNNHRLTKEDRFEVLEYGLFQLRNIPSNIYYYFLKTLDPVVLDGAPHATYILAPPYVTVHFPGTSFFVVSPIFLYLFRVRWREGYARSAGFALASIVFLLLTYYWPGWRQVGPRYLLDALPLAYLLLLHSFPGRTISSTAKVIIAASALFDVYLFTQVMIH